MSVEKTCPKCGGSGKIWINCPTDEACNNRCIQGYLSDGQTVCPVCNGTQRMTCRSCNGSGQIQINCHECQGTGKVTEPF